MHFSGVVMNYANSFFFTPRRPVYWQRSRLILWRYFVLVSGETQAILTDVVYEFS